MTEKLEVDGREIMIGSATEIYLKRRSLSYSDPGIRSGAGGCRGQQVELAAGKTFNALPESEDLIEGMVRASGQQHV